MQMTPVTPPDERKAAKTGWLVGRAGFKCIAPLCNMAARRDKFCCVGGSRLRRAAVAVLQTASSEQQRTARLDPERPGHPHGGLRNDQRGSELSFRMGSDEHPHGRLRVDFLGDLLDPPVVFRDSFVE